MWAQQVPCDRTSSSTCCRRQHNRSKRSSGAIGIEYVLVCIEVYLHVKIEDKDGVGIKRKVYMYKFLCCIFVDSNVTITIHKMRSVAQARIRYDCSARIRCLVHIRRGALSPPPRGGKAICEEFWKDQGETVHVFMIVALGGEVNLGAA